VIAYYGSERRDQELPKDLVAVQRFFTERLVLDEGVRRSIERTTSRVRNTVWVFRYYDLDDRRFPFYGAALVRLIGFIRDLASDREEEATGEPPKVNLIAHSMGGLIVREAVQVTSPELYGQQMAAADHINKIVTLGTPHQGISFQLLKDWIGPDAQQEIERFNPDFQADETNPASYRRFQRHFPPERLLTVVGTNYRTYGTSVSSLANRLFSGPGEFGPNYNRSDGLVKQAYAQIPGAPRTFVHKCHGGPDSLVTSREAFEVAMRFFFGDRKASLRLLDAEVTGAWTFSARARCSSGCRSSRAGSTSTCSTRRPTPRTATGHSGAGVWTTTWPSRGRAPTGSSGRAGSTRGPGPSSTAAPRTW
jgi:pimeloyl-ACP methyl ester carboxylesterase